VDNRFGILNAHGNHANHNGRENANKS
jgi:hypothetical protein